jgi:integrase
MRLTDISVKNAAPRAKTYKLTDGQGLIALVNPNGSKWWRLRYRFGGREKMLALGTYPEVSLREAREKADEARRVLADRRDPSYERLTEKAAEAVTFELIAQEWLALQKKTLSALTVNKARWMIDTFVLPYLGKRPITHVTTPEVLALLKRVENEGHHETAHRTKQRISQIFRYAIATGRAQRDPARDLRGSLAPVVTRSHAAITEPAQVGALLRAIDGYSGQFTTACALKLAPLVFVRPNELRAAEWSEFDLDRAEWRIAADRMKMKEAHVVPLSRQATKILKSLQPYTGADRFLFPSLRTTERPMSDNAINAALRRLGYSNDEMTGHGFRALASTRLNEMGWPPDVIELQLAHAERNKVRAVYNRAARLEERREMMQAWADYLDELRRPPGETPSLAGQRASAAATHEIAQQAPTR